MKCPKCGGGVTVSYPRDFGFVHRCNCCGKEWNSRMAVDSYALLRLVEAAVKNIPLPLPIDRFTHDTHLFRSGKVAGLQVLVDFLSGDQNPLKKLAGEVE